MGDDGSWLLQLSVSNEPDLHISPRQRGQILNSFYMSSFKVKISFFKESSYNGFHQQEHIEGTLSCKMSKNNKGFSLN